jgi:hypothetical protein
VYLKGRHEVNCPSQDGGQSSHVLFFKHGNEDTEPEAHGAVLLIVEGLLHRARELLSPQVKMTVLPMGI